MAFVGNMDSRSLVHRTLKAFRTADALPSIGAAIPNAIPGAGWSDHWSFWQHGFPAIQITGTALTEIPSTTPPETQRSGWTMIASRDSPKP